LKPYQIFGRMEEPRAAAVLAAVLDKTPAVYTQAVAAASNAFRMRPQTLMKMARDRRAGLLRQALARVGMNPVAEEVLAAYFLEARKELLVEWLDALGLEHEAGVLKQDAPPCPDAAKLEAAVSAFRQGEGREDRELLLRAFAAQSAVDWPALDALLGD
jgi:hypothetical protein